MFTAVGDANVSHETILTMMVTLFLGWPTVLFAFAGWLQTRARKKDMAVLTEANQKMVAKAAEVAERTGNGLAVIHTLVNANLTKAMESERSAIEQALGAITEAIDMKLTIGVEVLPESFAAQAKLEEQLSVLSDEIEERHATMRKILQQNGMQR